MLQVGVNENVTFSAEINDKKSLVITAKVKEEEKELDLNEASFETEGSNQSNVLFFPLKVQGYEDGVLVDKRSLKAILNDVKDFKALLTYILSQFTTLDNIKWDLFANSDLTNDNYAEYLVTDDGLRIVYDNLARQFVDYLEEYGDPEKLFRVLMVRTSKKSHYPNFRRRYLDTNPFIESMDIPAEQSKLKFTKSEISSGLDKGETVNPDTDGKDDSYKETLGL
jgi:hypothetical protein